MAKGMQIMALLPELKGRNQAKLFILEQANYKQQGKLWNRVDKSFSTLLTLSL